jgi:hypothetical protein
MQTDLAEVFQYLDELRESGRTNMWGASDYLVLEMDLERDEARRVLRLWMDTFDGESSVEERVSKATAE